MNEKDLKIKNILCFALAALFSYNLISAVVSGVLRDINADVPVAFVIMGALTTFIGDLPELFIIIFALKRKPHKFVVPLYIISGFAFVSAAFLAIGSFAILPDELSSISSALSRNVSPITILLNVIFGVFVFVCAKTYSKQRKVGNVYTKLFLIISFGLLLTDLVITVVFKHRFTVGNAVTLAENILLVLTVKYVETVEKKEQDGLKNYPVPEEMTEGE